MNDIIPTNPGDVVLDPFCGGGQVPEARIAIGRDYIAFEIDPKAAQAARERVAKLKHGPLFTLPKQLSLKEGL